MSLVEPRRYAGTLAGAVVLVVLGVFLGDQWVVALAGIPFGFLIFAAISGVPDPEIVVEREIEPSRPIPADPVTVNLTVRNEGSTTVPDLRLVDGLPPDLTVIDGRHSLATALAPDQSETLSYTVEATRGIHQFEEPQLRIRGASGDSYRDVTPTVRGDTEFTAEVFLDDTPTVRETATLVGAVTSDSGGSGVEFDTVREYRPGDPINRIEWRRYARDGQLATVNFREYGGLSLFVVADCRPAGDVDPGDGRAAGSDACQYAADRIVHAATEAGHETGLAVVGDRSIPWVASTTGNVYVRARTALRSVVDGADWDGPAMPPAACEDGSALAEGLLDRFVPGTQIVFVTPLGDDLPVAAIRNLRHHGYRVSVVSPDVGTDDSPGSRLVRAERNARIRRLRDEAATVVDWARADPLPVAISASTGETR